MGSNSGEAILLHGDLDLEIISAHELPNRDLFSERLRGCFASCASVPPTTSRSPSPFPDDGYPQHHHNEGITSDPYVNIRVGGCTVARTSVIHNTEEPHWNEQFKIPLAHRSASLEFHIKDKDIFGAQLIGVAAIPAKLVASGDPIKGSFPVLDPSSSKPVSLGAEIHISLKFTPVEQNPSYSHGITGDPKSRGVEDTYFPLRKGGMVTLYQDAHVNERDLPEIRLGDGTVFRHEKCWEDICHAILEAHHLIYIVGWSIHHKVRLVREPTRPLPRMEGKMTLGDLLKYKSEEGVRVCLLVWDDKTSHGKLDFKKAGVMDTHDEETRKFFKHSSVICVLSPRYPSSKLSLIKQQVVGTIFTHHQKCLIVDTQASQNRRKLTAFIGGLDLTDGRYDTPEHRLFRDRDTVFLDDFRNPSISAQDNKGPREPWHDLHCKIEGPAAYDVLTNFEERWKKATKFRSFAYRFSKVTHWRDDSLIKIERISWILSPSSEDPHGDPAVWVSSDDDPNNWHVQVFRSIDSGSVKFPPFNVEDKAKSKHLVRGKNIVIDKSIQTAYVKAIRSAKHFIYIENQYFIGSSYDWPAYPNEGADNLIPMELVLKIIQKIREGERFAVYVVVPMWPEGDPTSNTVQEILYWQGQTIMMMYAIIGRELQSMNIEHACVQDYLNFYCLGNREVHNSTLSSSNLENNPAALAQKHQRFMIYVHSKGMIVDDEYVILGSANINQRSLDGSRDTEIAMGAYQPHHTWASNQAQPRGQVYGYRKSLWAEHLGWNNNSEVLDEPQSLECVKYVNQIAHDNWVRYIASEAIPLEGHILKYPIWVQPNGVVSPLPGYETFPDVGGAVLGKSTPIPDNLTM